MTVMRYVKRLLMAVVVALSALIAIFAAGVLWPEKDLRAVRTTAPFAITNVGVVDVATGTIVTPRTIVVSNGRIKSVSSGAPPAGTATIDGRGRFLVPAFWDMHAHVLAVSPLLDLPLYIAYGVTNVRDMQGCPQKDDPFIACPEDKRRWTAEAESGSRVGPRVVASTSWMAEGPGIVRRLGDVPAYFDTATPQQAQQFVRHFAGTVDAIKVYNRIPRDAYLALAREARLLNIDVVGHRPYAVSAIEAAAHQRSIEHARFVVQESFAGSAALRRPDFRESHADRRRMLERHDPRLAQAIFDAMKANGTWYVPTHLTRWSDAYADHGAVREDALLGYLHPLLKRQWLEDIDEVLADDPSPAARETYRQYYRKGLELTGAAQR
ncbi:MAG TPA: amidohydrolase, partial [Thermoanaerobaculia bacterium]